MVTRTVSVRVRPTEVPDEMIGRPPGWMVRNGTILVGLILAALVAGSALIRYPDLVEAPVSLSYSTPPVPLVSGANGRLARLLVTDGAAVRKGDLVAVLDNPAETGDVYALKDLAQRIDTAFDLGSFLHANRLSNAWQVGELQNDYVQLYQAYSDLQHFFESRYFSEKLDALQAQVSFSKGIDSSLDRRSRNLAQQLSIEQTRDSANLLLRNQSVVAPLEYNESRKRALEQGLVSNDNQTMILQNRLARAEYQKQINEIRKLYTEEKMHTAQAFREAAKRLLAAVAAWERKYAFVAPQDGKVEFFRVWKENQYIYAGEAVFAVVPPQQAYEARMRLPVYKAGKVRVGQTVFIKLMEYPSEEYGMLSARVTSISSVALDSTYLLRMSLETGTTTTRGQVIEPRPELRGIGNVVTRDKSVLQRLFERVIAGRRTE